MRRRVPLRVQMLLLQLAIVLGVVGVTGFVALEMRQQQIRDAHEDRMIGVAQSVGRLPAVQEAMARPDPAAAIQPIAEVIRRASDVTYVVVTDAEGIRYSHPDPARIGEKVSTDPSVPLSGRTFVGTQQGTLGESWRVKVPLFNADGAVIGTVSVGTLEAELRREFYAGLPGLLGWLLGAVVVGTLAALGVSRLVWRRIHRLEPEEIAVLLETRDAMLHGIGEGVVALDEDGRVALLNDEARRLLALDDAAVGAHAAEVLETDLAEFALGVGSPERLVLAGERALLARRDSARVDGREVGVVLILRDRTELHLLLRDLEGARDLTVALRAQAHEFSNRMHVISGLLELERTQEARDFIERLGHGGAVARSAYRFDIDDPDATALLHAKGTIAAERDIELRVRPGSAYAGDGTDDVVTVLGNLIDNALDAVGADGVVEVALERRADGSVEVRVGDDGPGIDPSVAGRIFESGVSTKHADDGLRTRGIGLALVGRIVARRRGEISVERGPLGGAEFVVVLGPALVGAP